MNAETKLNTLYRIGSRVSLNKEQAKEFVGGRYRLEKLIAEKKIQSSKNGYHTVSPYAINACVCFFMLLIHKEQRI